MNHLRLRCLAGIWQQKLSLILATPLMVSDTHTEFYCVLASELRIENVYSPVERNEFSIYRCALIVDETADR